MRVRDLLLVWSANEALASALVQPLDQELV